MAHQNYVHIKDSIATQILKVVFTIYLLVTVTVTLLHMEAEYSNTKHQVIDELALFQNAYEHALRDALENHHQRPIDPLIFTLLENPNILGIQMVHEDTKEVFSVAGYFFDRDENVLLHEHPERAIQRVHNEFTNLFYHNYLLEFTDENGTLVPVDVTFYSSESVVLNKVKLGFYFIIANSVIKTLALWIIYLWVSRIPLTRPLSTLTSAAHNISLDNLEHFRIIVNTYGRNELKVMEEVFTSMVQNLLAARKKLEENMKNLKVIAAEGQKISSQRSYWGLAKQVNESFGTIAHRPINTELLYAGFVFKTDQPEAFYYVGNDDQSIVEVPFQGTEAQRDDQLFFDLKGTKDPSYLDKIRFGVSKFDKQHLENMIPLYRPLFVNILNTIRNISMVKELQSNATDLENKNKALQQMNKLKETFLANTSHELRTPLNGIIGISESLLDGAEGRLSPGQAQNLEMIVHSGKNLSHLINDLLDFSKMEHHELHLHYSQVDLTHVIGHTFGLLAQKAVNKSIVLDNQISQAIPFAYADESRVHQILMNLIDNAIKFTHEGKVTVQAECLDDMIKVSVSDTGIGIPEDFLDSLFNPFEQVDGSIAKEYGGTGLGLAVSKQLVELHGGSLEVKSIEHLGSVFSFTLPIFKGQSIIDGTVGALRGISPQTELSLAETPEKIGLPEMVQKTKLEKIPPHPPPPESETPPVTAPSMASGQTILVVDDEIINLQVLKNYLKIQGYHILTAQDGFEALDLIETETPDIILLDIMMPRMSGYEVCRKIRETHDLQDLPVIMLTARNQIEDLIEGFQSGANDYVTKPFYKEELLIRLQTHLHAKEAVDRLKEVGRLKETIAQKEQAEQALLASKRRLLRMLDLSETAIVSINREWQILFFNQQAEIVFGYSTQEIFGDPFQKLLANSNDQTLAQHVPPLKTIEHPVKVHKIQCQKQNGQIFPMEMSISSISHSRERNYAIVFHTIHSESDVKHESSKSIEAIEGALEGVNTLITETGGTLLEEVRQFGAKLDGVSETIDEDQAGLKVRNSIVQVMTLTVHYWEQGTQKSKVELAEESRIWKVYLDKGTYRTRTMDRYLYLTSLPKKPRWRSVISTAQFVLDSAPKREPFRSELLAAITTLEEALRHSLGSL